MELSQLPESGLGEEVEFVEQHNSSHRTFLELRGHNVDMELETRVYPIKGAKTTLDVA